MDVAPEEILALQGLVVRPILLCADVAARAKGLPRSSQDQHLDRGIGFPLLEQRSPADDRIFGESVVFLRTVERDRLDTVLVGVEEDRQFCVILFLLEFDTPLVRRRGLAGTRSGMLARVTEQLHEHFHRVFAELGNVRSR